MSRSITNLVLLAFSYAAANAAALVPGPPLPPQPPFLPAPGLEVNQGQVNAGVLFLSPASYGSIGVTAQSVLFSPVGATLNLVASNPNPTLSFSNPLPGLANSYTGADPGKWVTGIRRYAMATLTAIYPGIDAQYTVNTTGAFTLNLMLAPGANLNAVQFAIPQATKIASGSYGLTAIYGTGIAANGVLFFSAPLATQTGPSGQIKLNGSFVVQSATGFTLAVEGVDATLPLQIAIQLNANPIPAPHYDAGLNLWSAGAAGNTYYAVPMGDAAGKTAAPFPTLGNPGCGVNITVPVPCADVAVYKYSASGVLEFITYLAGSVNDMPGFLGINPDGQVVVAGTTDSADFPMIAGSFQTTYAGPPPTPMGSDQGVFQPSLLGGDFFAAILDPATGKLQSATFLGGPNLDTFGTAAIGADGSLYFLPAYLINSSSNMPVTSGALLAACQSSPQDGRCDNGYAAHLSPGLDKLLYGTYLPGNSRATAQLYSDGSVYYAGTAQAGFPTTPNAYQPQNAGGYDGIIGRLDPTGSKLIFATYFGGPNNDGIGLIAVAPGGSVWAGVSSIYGCCTDVSHQLIHLDASGSKLLADVPIYPLEMVTDHAGNLYAFAKGAISVSPDALLGGSCGGAAYIELSPSGQQLFATYLPANVGGFVGADAQGTPYLASSSGTVQVVPSQPSSTAPYAGCVVDAAYFGTQDQGISPGQIVTIFGSGLGPSPGVGFQLVNGQVPTSLGGTQVLVDGEPAPILYSSYGQVNLILPYSLTIGTKPSIEVVSNGTPANTLSNLEAQAAGITMFQLNGSAAALNQDGTINSAQNPARPGSTVALFGTGGGQTNPASVAGNITPPELRPLIANTQVYVDTNSLPAVQLSIEYAGAAPELLSGVTQVNVTLPDVIPATYYPPGVLPLFVNTNGQLFGNQTVTIFVATK
jgi:uncharacterized protein (TIGR03437 family)